jgi:nucleotide-binding universal stress UspA family protein
MTFKSILVHADGHPRAQVRCELAARLAQTFDAHLTGLFTASMTFVAGSLPASPIYDVSAILLGHLNESADMAHQTFMRAVDHVGVERYEWRQDLYEPVGAMLASARYHDLVVMGQHDPERAGDTLPDDFVQQVLLGAGRPILVVPHAGSFDTVGQHVLVAWNTSKESTRAVTDALPLLRRARKVTVLTLNAAQSADEYGEIPGSGIALFLERHGVHTEVRNEQGENIAGTTLGVTLGAGMGRETARRIDAGNLILSRAADLECDLIVMGGYGHSRLRELVLGGATRTLLNSMTVPVLLSH